uniref:Transposase n=1 Tax=Mesocestoides corti TaxID=53468 RepID=A0A5K3EJE7_MESCO
MAIHQLRVIDGKTRLATWHIMIQLTGIGLEATRKETQAGAKSVVFIHV